MAEGVMRRPACDFHTSLAKTLHQLTHPAKPERVTSAILDGTVKLPSRCMVVAVVEGPDGAPALVLCNRYDKHVHNHDV